MIARLVLSVFRAQKFVSIIERRAVIAGGKPFVMSEFTVSTTAEEPSKRTLGILVHAICLNAGGDVRDLGEVLVTHGRPTHACLFQHSFVRLPHFPIPVLFHALKFVQSVLTVTCPLSVAFATPMYTMPIGMLSVTRTK